MSGIGYRDRAVLPKLGVVAPARPVLLDRNVFIEALAGRGPPELRTMLANLPLGYVSGPIVAELSWPAGRLDPAHPDAPRVLARFRTVLAQIHPGRVLVPTAAQWAEAGILAGRAARAVAGGGRSLRTAFDRIELMNDAVTAVVAMAADVTIVTKDIDFDLFRQIEPTLDVIFYD